MRENMKRIKYICYYPESNNLNNRKCNEAAVTKIDYIISVINRIGYAVDIISPAVISKNGLFAKGGLVEVDSNTIRHFPSFCFDSRFLRLLSRKITHFFFRSWLLNNLIEGERVIVYHSLGYCKELLDITKKKRIHLIGEIEEIYQDVHPQSALISKAEYDFFKICNGFIFPNTVLNEKVNEKGLPSIVVHGLYSVKEQVAKHFDDGKIHVLYAGTFDPMKGGALAAVEATEYLDDKYHIHVTGFGNPSQQKELKEGIEKLSSYARARLTFHGFILREQLTSLMQQCHIGLCTQDPTKELNLTSFPSKILNYLSNGLIVLSGRNRAIEESAIGDIVRYYESQTPQEIAQAIRNIDVNDIPDGVERLRQLDGKFAEELKILL